MRPVARLNDIVSGSRRIITASSTVFIGDAGGGGGVVSGPVIADPNSYKNALPLIKAVGTSGIDDEPTTNDGKDVYPPQPLSPDKITMEEAKSPPPGPPVSVDCAGIGTTTPIDYNFQLSPNIKLGDLSIKCVFAHSVRAQNGLQIPDIVCNLKALSESVLEPIIAQFGRPRFNSAFRTTQNGRSQHEFGQAADLQWPGIANQKYLEIAQRIASGFTFDQLLMEHGSSIWIHVSFNKQGNRKDVRTMINNTYPPGLKLYY